MTIESMNAAHVPQIARLEELCFSDPWSENSIASELDNPLSMWLVAEEKGAVVGYIGSQTVLDSTDIMNIAVHPDFRRRGVAESLLVELSKRLKERGVSFLMLEVRASNEPAKRLYEKLGFQQVGCRKNYYRNPKEDGWIYRLTY